MINVYIKHNEDSTADRACIGKYDPRDVVELRSLLREYTVYDASSDEHYSEDFCIYFKKEGDQLIAEICYGC